MRKESSKGIRRQMGDHDKMREFNREAKVGNPLPQFVVVGEVVHKRFETTDPIQVASSESQSRTQSKPDVSLQLACHEHTSTKIRTDTQRFQTRAEGRGSLSAVKARDHANFLVRKGCDDLIQIIGLYPNVAVIDNQVLVTRVGQHLCQVAYFYIRAQRLGANHEANLPVGKLALKLPHAFHRGVVRVAHTKNDFV